MFEQLVKHLCALSRQRNALAYEGASFVARRAEDGATPRTLVRLARERGIEHSRNAVASGSAEPVCCC